MSEPSHRLSTLLTHPGTVALSGNIPFVEDLGVANLSLRQQPSGHWVVYGPLGRRILFTDPEGHPLHECEWESSSNGQIRLIAARMFLDWNQWVGIKPSGLVNSMTMDLSTRPGWEALTRQDLRLMASQAMGVALEEVEFFYTDEDLRIDASGQATIQQRKDAFYILEDGTFHHSRFMSCMSAMHWDAIDYLPVVELFKSLLPGTGSAAFELIRGLYDDQNPQIPRSLQYRGIPTYPSDAAFGLFSQYFTASFSGRENPFTVFMDTPRSHQVSWLPNANPPCRYIDSAQGVCLTVAQGRIQKVTVMDDSTGLPFSASNPQGFAACARTLSIKDNQLILQDKSITKTLQVKPMWSVSKEQNGILSSEISSAPDWRTLFPQGVPSVKPADAFSAVLLYPQDDSPIEEFASQPFIADFLDDFVEQNQQLAIKRSEAQHVLIHTFDAAIGTCLLLDQHRPHRVMYSHAALAQKQAQLLWNQLARSHRLDWLSSFRFLPMSPMKHSEKFNWIYRWIPFADYQQDQRLLQNIQDIVATLAPQGLAFVAGPESIPALVANLPVRILFGEAGSELQPFLMHRSILPKSRLNPHLHIWCLQKI
ncbi:hypothetical protein [Candidatus Nitronereus thalassa]|uniref:Uncharacterized protein n=1 Tax=Candidatus Nitronereus thalassa TaxID=3020898 RepID=A0ABU3K3Y0_9BACT|nr:hypothetical protein [Candidatus Nitronereus thalassa]MDT7041115.1 hypothetical protein [Candidatus Nitronereus thalassa]